MELLTDQQEYWNRVALRIRRLTSDQKIEGSSPFVVAWDISTLSTK